MSFVPLFTLSSGEVVGRIVGSEIVRKWTPHFDLDTDKLKRTLQSIALDLDQQEETEKVPFFPGIASFAVLNRADGLPLRTIRVTFLGSTPFFDLSVFSFKVNGDHRSDPVGIMANDVVVRTLRAFRFLIVRFGFHLLENSNDGDYGRREIIDIESLLDTIMREGLESFVRSEEESLGIAYAVRPELLELSDLLRSRLPVFAPTKEFVEWQEASGLPRID